uniref:Uncharacterized protein n=1 Tax=Rousettus aegyptiacus TaxID=9407 RepID=A0A7J8H1I0_ROUAE|nr:hypothetical protein HJG63_011287 [Rousettus aegyptiacus]
MHSKVDPDEDADETEELVDATATAASPGLEDDALRGGSACWKSEKTAGLAPVTRVSWLEVETVMEDSKTPGWIKPVEASPTSFRCCSISAGRLQQKSHILRSFLVQFYH